jgi:hypothetical protein
MRHVPKPLSEHGTIDKVADAVLASSWKWQFRGCYLYALRRDTPWLLAVVDFQALCQWEGFELKSKYTQGKLLLAL